MANNSETERQTHRERCKTEIGTYTVHTYTHTPHTQNSSKQVQSDRDYYFFVRVIFENVYFFQNFSQDTTLTEGRFRQGLESSIDVLSQDND